MKAAFLALFALILIANSALAKAQLDPIARTAKAKVAAEEMECSMVLEVIVECMEKRPLSMEEHNNFPLLKNLAKNFKKSAQEKELDLGVHPILVGKKAADMRANVRQRISDQCAKINLLDNAYDRCIDMYSKPNSRREYWLQCLTNKTC